MELEDFSVGRNQHRPVEVNLDPLRPKEIQRRLRVGPLSGRDGAATVVVTATGIANTKLGGIPVGWFVALMLMRHFADAARMRRGSRDRQRERNKVSREREEQQQSGGEALHTFS